MPTASCARCCRLSAAAMKRCIWRPGSWLDPSTLPLREGRNLRYANFGEGLRDVSPPRKISATLRFFDPPSRGGQYLTLTMAGLDPAIQLPCHSRESGNPGREAACRDIILSFGLL